MGGRLALLLLLLLLGGCSTLRYYGQSVSGHLDLLWRARPIEKLIADPDTDSALRQRLQLARDMRRFASEQLGLPRNRSYTRYVSLDRPAVVWSVVATPELSLTPKQWCYPVIGCASYRGYFAQADAQAEAERLMRQGLDTVVEPVPAYSTLGWTPDPLPQTVIDWPDADLAGLIFHELAHQRLYLAGDSAFNEAFASAVEWIGVQRWLEKDRPQQLADWRHRRAERERFTGLLMTARQRLIGLYASDQTDEQQRAGKARIFGQLRADYRAYRQRPDALNFDHWFERPLNNARLASVATYRQWRDAFLQLYRENDDDMAAFFGAAERLGQQPASSRKVQLEALLARYAAQ